MFGKLAAGVGLALACLAAPAEPAPGSGPTPAGVRPAETRTAKPAGPGTAALLSNGGLVLPIVASTMVRNENADARRGRQLALVGLGVVVGPALGYWYGGVPRPGTRGMIGRLACAAVASAGCLYLEHTEELDVLTLGVGVAGLAGAGAAGVWALWDAASVAPRVEARNRRLRSVSWSVDPPVSASGTPALALSVRF